jgi:hypothetical protein
VSIVVWTEREIDVANWREIMAGPAAATAEEAEPAEVQGDPPYDPTPKPKREGPAGKANRLAVTALILACIGPVLVGGILATVFGYVALDEIEDSEGTERGRAIGQWAIALGFLNIALSCVAIVYLVSVIAK